MLIVYDFEEGLTLSQKEFLYEGESGKILHLFKKFLFDRWKLFLPEIDQYPDGKIVIHRFDKQIRFYGYPKFLVQKMLDSVSQDDFDYLSQKIYTQIYPPDKSNPQTP